APLVPPKPGSGDRNLEDHNVFDPSAMPYDRVQAGPAGLADDVRPDHFEPTLALRAEQAKTQDGCEIANRRRVPYLHGAVLGPEGLPRAGGDCSHRSAHFLDVPISSLPIPTLSMTGQVASFRDAMPFERASLRGRTRAISCQSTFIRYHYYCL